MHIPSTHRLRFLFVCQLVILLGYPYLDASREALGALNVLLTVLCVAALHVAGAGDHVPRMGLALGVPAIVGLWLPLETTSPMRLLGLGFETVLFLYVTVVLIAHVFRMEEVTEDTLSGAACAYLFMGLAFAAIYVLIERLLPGSFRFPGVDPTTLWSDLLYFSFTSLTTTGYGDITPVSHQARSLVSIEHILGVLYPAVVVARLVGLYKSSRTGS